MKRYATIEHNSGYVWWVGEAPDPEGAVLASDSVDRSSAGMHRYTEVYHPRNMDADGGFYVYEVPAEFDAVAEDYELVEKHKRVGMFRAQLIGDGHDE